MTLPRNMDPRQMHWVTVPVDETADFAPGVITHIGRQHTIGYFFGLVCPQRPEPSVFEGLRAEDAALIAMMNTLNISRRNWTLVASRDRDDAAWPLPRFAMEAGRGQAEIFELDPQSLLTKTQRLVPGQEANGLPDWGTESGYGVEVTLARLIASNGKERFHHDPTSLKAKLRDGVWTLLNEDKGQA